MNTATLAVAGHVYRQTRVGALALGAAAALTALASALTYATTFTTAASRRAVITATGSNPGLRVLFGSVSHLDTVGGYTAYKGFVVLTTLGAFWALLRTTRLLRGEEDAGRWQLLLAAPLRAGGATLAVVLGLLGAILTLTATIAVVVGAAGGDSDLGWGLGAAAFYAVSLAVPVVAALGIGVLTAQLGSTRRVANLLGAGVLALAFAVRMVADAGHRWSWLLWLTPFGWTERMNAFVAPDARPLLLAVAITALACVAGALVAGRRDCGAGMLVDRSAVAPRLRGLGSTAGLGIRLERPALLAWITGTTLAAAAFGIVSRIATRALPQSLDKILHRFGGSGPTLDQFLGTCYLLLATLLALMPAGQVGALAAEESSGRLALIAALPVSRRRILVERLLLTCTATCAAALLTVPAVWAGARVAGSHPRVEDLFAAAANVVPTVFVVSALGALALAVAPRAAATSTYAVVAASFVTDLVAASVPGWHWLRFTSVLHYMTVVPSHPLSPVRLLGTLGLAVALAALAVQLFGRRDLSDR